MEMKEILKNRTARNAGWLIAGRLANKALSLLVGILTARYLGPGNYGLIQYASAYITFFAALCNLGISNVIIKDFSDHPEEVGSAIGTTLVMRFVSSLLSAVMICGIVFLTEGGGETVLVAALSSVSLLFQVFDTFQQWFQSRLQSKYAAVAGVLAFLAGSVYKLWLLWSGKGVAWFALTTTVEYLAAATLMLLSYRKLGGPGLRFSLRKGRELLRASGGYILSGLMVSVYAVTDKLMLKALLDEASVGYYAMAVSVSNMWVFILQAVIDSVCPSIIDAHSRDKGLFDDRNRRLYAVVIWMSLGMSAVVSLLAKPIVTVLYGESYLPAVAPLRVVVWYTAFSFLGVARNAWVVCENAQRYLKYIYFGAAVLNVALNCLLIPVCGTVGAAWASLLTQVSTIVIFPAVIKPLRPNGRLMLEGLLMKDIWKEKRNGT